jgi:transglutaminase-like putative cysteine protease
VAAALLFAISRPPAPPRIDPPAPEGLLARRCYEKLLSGQRAGIHEVQWFRHSAEGEPLVRDRTVSTSRTERQMGPERDLFDRIESSDLVRTEEGGLVSLESRTVDRRTGRVDTVSVHRTPDGYAVDLATGGSRESFGIRSPSAAMLDAEPFLGLRIAEGTAKPGSVFEIALLDLERRAVVPARLEVVGEDPEGPGLKVVQRSEGRDILLWFGPDGAIARLRAGDFVLRRADRLTLDHDPRRPARFSILIASDQELPRLFTGLAMDVELEVRVDETVALPEIPPNPFTEPLEATGDRLRLRLKTHDHRDAAARLPIEDPALARFLEPTLLMEVRDPRLRERARGIVGGESDARKAAARIADFVFRFLRKESPASPSPSALEILQERTGDCSEHALLFTALCRAAGIPARQCSGLVNIGPEWGHHGWAEIWVGAWIGADPTTNEIGTRARYILCARPDEPEMRPATILAERTSIRILRARYADGEIDFAAGDVDPVVRTGLRLGRLPAGWRAAFEGTGAEIRGPDSRFEVFLEPDQGYRALDLLERFEEESTRAEFGGRPALRLESGWIVPLGRQNLRIVRTDGHGDGGEALVSLLRPTLDRDDG